MAPDGVRVAAAEPEPVPGEPPVPTGGPWTVLKLLRAAAGHLSSRGIDSARLDAELLLARVIDCDRLALYVRHDMPVDDAARGRYRELVRRRAAFEPVAYLLGEREFHGLTFRVDARCLIPRPETEHLVDEALAWLETRPGSRAVDVGTGSGCIAITVAAKASDVTVHAVDRSADALELARENARRLAPDRPPVFHEGDLLAPVAQEGPFHLVLSNPPYITSAEMRDLDVGVRDHEPAMALDSGRDPLAFHRRLLSESRGILAPNARLLMELPDDAREAAERLVSEIRPDATVAFVRDLRGVDRVLVVDLGA